MRRRNYLELMLTAVVVAVPTGGEREVIGVGVGGMGVGRGGSIFITSIEVPGTNSWPSHGEADNCFVYLRMCVCVCVSKYQIHSRLLFSEIHILRAVWRLGTVCVQLVHVDLVLVCFL